MAKFTLTGDVTRLQTEVHEIAESIILEAGQVYDTAEPAVINHLRSLECVVESEPEPTKAPEPTDTEAKA